MDTCATIHKEYICCNVKVLKSISNCPFDCSYCFLQDYLNSGALSYVSDTKTLIKEVKQKCEAQPWRLFRIGTWELGDSLALEDKIGQAQELIAAFSTIPNALLELKTKSDNVDPILNCDHKKKTVVSFSLNPAYIVDKEEHKTAPLHKRLQAIKKAQKAGYLIGLHIDPMIAYPDWEAGYGELIDAIFKHVSPNQVAWISMGSLRFNPEQKRLMHINFPGSKIASNEMVLGSDRKLRYVKPFRLMMYKYLYQKLCEKGAQDACVYLCMERFNVWESVFGYSPTSIGHLDYLFADSLGKRFKHLSNIKPDLTLYERFQDS
jgi:spore photoproduct lyase